MPQGGDPNARFRMPATIPSIAGIPVPLQVTGHCSICGQKIELQIVTIYPRMVGRVRCENCGNILVDGVEALKGQGWPGPGEDGYTEQEGYDD